MGKKGALISAPVPIKKRRGSKAPDIQETVEVEVVADKAKDGGTVDREACSRFLTATSYTINKSTTADAKKRMDAQLAMEELCNV